MADIVLTSLNSRYYHCAASLVFLKANLGEYEERAVIREFVVKCDISTVVEEIVSLQPRMVLISVYIWNARETRELVCSLRERASDVCIVLGGPEVSYAPQDPVLIEYADYVVCGEGEVAARELVADVLNGTPPAQKMINGVEISMEALRLPYRLYTDEDVAHRIVYVETSRGCPYKCEYCLSSLDNHVRFVPLDVLFPELDILIERGVKLFKLLDRTFNTRIARSVQILEFFLERYRTGMQIHMEFIPDRLPPALKEIIRQFPPEALQFEIGVQSYNQEILDRIQRRQKSDVVHENIKWMINCSNAVVHADLIIGLPGEDEESFAYGFNQLVGLYPQHIQINLLKLLKGTPLARHCGPFKLVFDSEAPFEIQSTSSIDTEAMQQLSLLSRYWTLFHNQERFRRSLPLIWRNGSPYDCFMAFCHFVFHRFQRRYGISLDDQTHVLFDYLVEHAGVSAEEAGALLIQDYGDEGKRWVPRYLKEAAGICP